MSPAAPPAQRNAAGHQVHGIYRQSETVALNLSYAHIFVKTATVDRLDPLFAGTPAVTTVRTFSRNTGNADELAGSISLKF